MRNITEYINDALITESVRIDNEYSDKFDEFLEYIKKYSKSLRIQNAEKQRYEKKGNAITKEIAQDLLSKRLYNNVSVRYDVDTKFFLDTCKKHNITVNMGNLGFGTDEVIEWGVPKKKMNSKDIYFDDADLVWVDKTIGYRLDDGGIEMLPEYEDYAEEVLAIKILLSKSISVYKDSNKKTSLSTKVFSSYSLANSSRCFNALICVLIIKLLGETISSISFNNP
jgi:hypothetical protein